MKQWNGLFLGVLLGLGILGSLEANGAAETDLLAQAEVQNFIQRMQKSGYELAELKSIFATAQVQQSILKAMNNPAEGKKWFEYRPIFIQPTRIKGGKDFLQAHNLVLDKATTTYGVPAEIITAIVGVETRYGTHAGNHLVLDALVTLGFFYPRRGDFFQNELEQFLLLAREEKFDPLKIKGSYAGAMGVPQFIPSSYRHYAVDFDGNGQKDLFASSADVVGSVANYFARHGWRKGEPVAVKAQVSGEKWRDLPAYRLQRPDTTLAALSAYGVRSAEEVADDLPVSFLTLELENGPEHWLVFNNFFVITRYNRSSMYAMAVWQLSQEILSP